MLQPGRGPIRTGGALAIVKFGEQRPTVVASFDAAKNVVRQQLEAQAPRRAMTALIDKLATQTMISAASVWVPVTPVPLSMAADFFRVRA
ncbi:hypothetical protein [Burkholderia cepacia]|uniref:hypothetical protein n=1 Tax=Burkholderia cepacia TaxID=292 RepID=UPI00075CE10E|nr:hypothetical protein [Burkholderia cepacia]KVK92632.1 hypothetical protein WS93_29485 [Burkholderia cepacia]